LKPIYQRKFYAILRFQAESERNDDRRDKQLQQLSENQATINRENKFLRETLAGVGIQNGRRSGAAEHADYSGDVHSNVQNARAFATRPGQLFSRAQDTEVDDGAVGYAGRPRPAETLQSGRKLQFRNLGL
jgi:hypothetical protein